MTAGAGLQDSDIVGQHVVQEPHPVAACNAQFPRVRDIKQRRTVACGSVLRGRIAEIPGDQPGKPLLERGARFPGGFVKRCRCRHPLSPGLRAPEYHGSSRSVELCGIAPTEETHGSF